VVWEYGGIKNMEERKKIREEKAEKEGYKYLFLVYEIMFV